MLPAFMATVSSGKLAVSELENRSKILDGKHLAVMVLEVNDKNQVTGGDVVAGVYESGHGVLVHPNGTRRALHDLEGRQVMVVVRHELVSRIGLGEFERQFQLGARPGDLDT